MKAAYIEGHGGPEALKYGDRPDPVAGADEVVVDIHAASINGADWKVRAGGSIPQSAFPYILGRDFSGVVSAVGEDVDDLQIGDHVFAVCDAGQEGAYAEQIAIKASIVAHKPEDVSHVDACALALTGLTALIAVEDTLHLESGETILIQGGAGGVAGFAIELAKHLGARVITTASATNHEYLRELGADEIIDLDRNGIDMAIRYGSGDYPGLRSDRLLSEEQFVVCSPQLVNEGPHPLRAPEDLRYHTLLHDETSAVWQRWLKEMEVSGVNAARGPTFNHSNVVIEAAIDGQGVAVARSAIAAPALADGRLVRPFEISLPLTAAYFVVSSQANANRPKVEVFREWLLAEAGGDVVSR